MSMFHRCKACLKAVKQNFPPLTQVKLELKRGRQAWRSEGDGVIRVGDGWRGALKRCEDAAEAVITRACVLLGMITKGLPEFTFTNHLSQTRSPSSPPSVISLIPDSDDSISAPGYSCVLSL